MIVWTGGGICLPYMGWCGIGGRRQWGGGREERAGGAHTNLHMGILRHVPLRRRRALVTLLFFVFAFYLCACARLISGAVCVTVCGVSH